MGSGLVGPNGAPLDPPEGAYVKDGAAKATIAEAFAIVHQETPKILGPVVQRMASDMGTMRADIDNLRAALHELQLANRPPNPLLTGELLAIPSVGVLDDRTLKLVP